MKRESSRMPAEWDVVVVGSGNAALSAGLAALERGASVLVIEKAERDLAGGNTAYTAGAMRFVYEGNRFRRLHRAEIRG